MYRTTHRHPQTGSHPIRLSCQLLSFLGTPEHKQATSGIRKGRERDVCTSAVLFLVEERVRAV